MMTDQRGQPRGNAVDIGAFQASLVVESTSASVNTDVLSMTLPGAVSLANEFAGTEISFDPIVFARRQVIVLGGSQLELSNTALSTTITGPTPGVTISGGGLSRVFQIDGGVTAAISNLTITGGTTAGNGGGLYNIGTTTLTLVIISDDSASSNGGGVDNSGSMIVMDSHDHGQLGPRSAGIENTDTMTVTDSTLSDNSAHYGGAIDNPGAMTLTDSTISDNSAVRGGSGIDNEGTVTATDSTISGNLAAFVPAYSIRAL